MQTYFFSLLTKALNNYIALDPESKPRIQSLEGKTITLKLKGPNITFQLHITQGMIQLYKDATLDASTQIQGTPLALLRLALTKEKEQRQSFFGGDLTIEGDTQVAEQVIAIFDHLEIDWEEYSSRILGDVAAHELGKFVRKIKSFNQTFRDTLIQNTNEYVHEEARFFPCKEELDDFYNDVDNTRMDVDRVAVRIAKLNDHLNRMGE